MWTHVVLPFENRVPTDAEVIQEIQKRENNRWQVCAMLYINGGPQGVNTLYVTMKRELEGVSILKE